MTDKSNSDKARALLLEADKKLNSKGIFDIFYSSSNKTERALEYYEKAANLFKMAKEWDEAGGAFVKAANLCPGNKIDAAIYFVNASNCFKKNDPQKAINYILKAIEIYIDNGKFIVAAQNHEKIAVIYENVLNSIEQAVHHYEQAADYYRGEERDNASNKCLQKVASYCSKNFSNYKKAIDIYEEIAASELRSTLLKYNVKEHFFRAALCQICEDVTILRMSLERYVEIFPAFSDTREYKLLIAIIEAIENEDEDAFTKAVEDYDNMSKLDPWYVSMLLRIKKRISAQPDIC